MFKKPAKTTSPKCVTSDNINEFILRENEIKQRRIDMLNALTHHEKVVPQPPAPPVLSASNICEN